MATGKALNGKPYAGNPHVRFDEGEAAPAATPRRGSLLYKKILATILAAVLAGGAWGATLTVGSSGADYTTLKAAFAAVSDGDTVQLIEDIAYSTTQAWNDKLVVNGKKVTFDLNGHNVTYTRSANPSGPMFYLQNGAELLIDGTGTIVLTPITASHTVFSCVSMADNTGLKATLGENVTVYAECFGSVEYNTSNAETGSTFDIYGTIIGNNSSYINNLFSCPSGVKNFTVNILGGTLAIPKYADQHINIQASTETTFTLNMASGKIYCTQANFNAVKFNLYAAVKSTFNITGGYFGSNVPKAGTDPTLGFSLPVGYGFYPVSGIDYCPYQVGVCEAKIGNVCYPSIASAIEAAKASDFVTLNVDYSDVVTIPSGKTVNFNSGSYTFAGSFTVNGTLKIVGGTYTFNPAVELLGPGCSVTDNGDGTWTVIQSVAQVGETSYTTFADALAAANALGTATIKFLADVDLGSSSINIASGKNITLDLNGNNVTCSASDQFSVKSGATLILRDTSEGESGTLTHSGQYDLSDNSGTVEILGGTYNVVNYGVAYNNGSAVLNIKGGTINSTKRAYYKGVTTISGGTINGTINDVKTTVITGGTFDHDPSAYVASGYTAIDNQNGTWTVGQVVIETGDLQPSAPVAADATEATYTVSTTVKVDGNVVSSTVSQTVNVSVPSSDIGGTTLSSVKLDSVITAAIESQGTDASAVTDIEILVSAVDTNTVNEAIVYEVKPEAVVTVTKGNVSTQSEPIELSNDDLAPGASFTVLLDVTPLGAEAGDSVKVAHESDDPAYAKETYFVQAFVDDDGKVYVRVTVSHFSTFTLSLLSTQPVTTSVRSANLFGAVKVDGVASNMFVAVPFDGFDGGARQAKDVVHPAGLANDTKMYVYDPSTDKYDVFKTSAGAWTQASKVTIGATGAASVDNPNLERGVKSGSGVIVERTDKTQALYLYGQIPTNTSVTITTESALVSVPSTNALEAVDLNALDWTGVTSSTCNTAGTRLSSNGGKDMIKFRDPDGKTVSYYYFGGKWGPNYRPSSWNGKATVPAGTAFWYTKKEGTATTVTVKW